VDSLAAALTGSNVVVCCAGNPDASSRDLEGLFGANAALPGVSAAAAAAAGARRFIHVSSAAVQGGAERLDASDDTQAFSPYARSKIDGEHAVTAAPSPDSTVIFRPPSVHSSERRVTRGIRMLARSPLSSVVGPGTDPTPQAHIENVAAAVAELALTPSDPPPVVIHPLEGWTTAELMRTFGSGREPLHIPAALGPVLRQALHLAAAVDRLAPNARRVEMMWFGQAQDESWLTEQGWTPPVGREAWRAMIDQIDHRTSLTTGTS
jgi:nucleoside-diphosphate-sugar epimerase